MFGGRRRADADGDSRATGKGEEWNEGRGGQAAPINTYLPPLHSPAVARLPFNWSWRESFHRCCQASSSSQLPHASPISP